MNSVFQFTVGFGNKSVIVENNEKPLPISEVLAKLYGLFREEDAEINKLIPNGVVTTKTNEVSEFRSDKILSSLLKVGIPLELTVRVLEMVIVKIQSLVSKTHDLSTKDIRRHVADAIRNIESVDSFEAEEWSYRYTRKYGHDSRRVVICNFPEGGNVEISYSVIYKVVREAFSLMIPTQAVDEIPRRQLDNIASYVLEFVNSCDMYYFDYQLLVGMVVEMARQPPHPWVITQKTRNLLYEYDIDAIESNILQIQNAESGDIALRYCCAEIVHHASSLMLEKYEWFLGLDDFTSFYILKSLINKYNTTEFLEILSMNHSMQKLERDISLIGESLCSLSALMADIHKVINNVNTLTKEDINNVVKYGRLAISLVRDDSAERIIDFIKKDWNIENSGNVLDNVSKILSTLTHASNARRPNIELNFFRFVFKPLEVDGHSLKKQYLVFFVDQYFNYDILKKLMGRKYTEQADTILVLSPNDEQTEEIALRINKETNDNYWCLAFFKSDLIALLESDNQAQCFFELIENKVSSVYVE